jgi:solute carrier family 13 (sodium-dependent dicarboxylate transporter), member 2/3/5
MSGIALWMVIWWISEAVNLAITALIPVLMLPFWGIAEVKSVAQQYTDSIIFLFFGGFMIAFAIEKWGLHKRIALKILSLVGVSPRTVLFGTMLAAFLISNWISNTATTMMLFSAVLALVHETKQYLKKGKEKFAAAMLMGLAFSATIGGMATPVGTPPNMYFFKVFRETYAQSIEFNFLKWSMIGFPIAIVFLWFTYFVLSRYFLDKSSSFDIGRSFFKEQYVKLGKMGYEEKWVFGIFMACVLLWFSRADIDMGSFKLHGWANLMKAPKYIDDSFVALAAALLLFLLPSKLNSGEALLVWDDAKKIRYDIILMFGSGFALAYGFEVTGLSNWLAEQLLVLKGVRPVFIILGICVIVTLISEFASNIASIQLAIPVMMALQKNMDISPMLLMIPATFAASLGFMLPVATAANTIVFGTKMIHIRDMFKVGIILDIIGILIITLMCYLYLS